MRSRSLALAAGLWPATVALWAVATVVTWRVAPDTGARPAAQRHDGY